MSERHNSSPNVHMVTHILTNKSLIPWIKSLPLSSDNSLLGVPLTPVITFPFGKGFLVN